MATITITGEIDSDNVDVLKQYFLTAQPIPKDDDGEDLYSFNAWLKKKVWAYVRGEIKEGKRISDAQASNLDNIIE